VRVIDSIWLDFTTACNRKCEHCCCNIPNRQAVNYSWDYFEHLARYVYGVRRIHLTGGEATAHPKFAKFVPRLKELFGCELLTLWTNGFRIRENANVLHHFDDIFGTLYDDNAAEIEWMVENVGATYLNGDTHVNRAHRGGGNPCGRGRSDAMVIYSDGRLFPCCIGPGIPGAQSIKPCDEWRTKVLAVPLPCKDCWFSE